MSSDYPKISIITVVRNAVTTLEKAILSVINQQYENVEYIVIDGASTDGTLDIIKKYAAHIAYWQSSVDGSPSAAKNIGLQHATGDFIAFLFADDWYEPETFSKIVDAIRNNPDANCITCGGRVVTWDTQTHQYKPYWVYCDAKTLELTIPNICFAVSAIGSRFMRRAFVEQIGFFIPFDATGRNNNYCSDKEWLIRAVLLGVKDVFVNHMGYNYLAHTGSSTFGRHVPIMQLLYQEHIHIAETYLTHPKLSTQQKKTLRYWQRDQSARIVLWAILQGDWTRAWRLIKEYSKRFGFSWSYIFLSRPIVILVNRSKFFIQQKQLIAKS